MDTFTRIIQRAVRIRHSLRMENIDLVLIGFMIEESDATTAFEMMKGMRKDFDGNVLLAIPVYSGTSMSIQELKIPQPMNRPEVGKVWYQIFGFPVMVIPDKLQ